MFEDRTANYADGVAHAAQQYNNQTDLSVTQCPYNGDCGTVIFIEAYYGGEPGTFAGLSFNYSHSNPCHVFAPPYNSTGYCNTSNHRVDFGYIYFNNYYGVVSPVRWSTKHEAGHSFGLNHLPDCSILSVMLSSCPQLPVKLKAHDKADVNVWY